MYHFSRKKYERDVTSKHLWIAYFVGNALVWGAVVVIVLQQGLSKTYTMETLKSEAILISITAIALAFGYPLYGIRLFRMLSKAVISSNRKNSMMIRV
jgi:hypothetical protein